MLELKIDIVPFGNESKRRTLDKLIIINTATHPKRPEWGKYICHHSEGSFIIENHKREDGFWSLIRKCINEYLD